MNLVLNLLLVSKEAISVKVHELASYSSKNNGFKTKFKQLREALFQFRLLLECEKPLNCSILSPFPKITRKFKLGPNKKITKMSVRVLRKVVYV